MKYFYLTPHSHDVNKNKVLSKNELMGLNKQYIVHIVRLAKLVKITTPTPQNIVPLSMHIPIPTMKIQYIEDEIEEPYTIEEIQNIKREKFNDELLKKQQEFSQLIQQQPVLPILNFNDDCDKPISKMEDLISQTIAQRELDVVNFKQKLPPPPRSLAPKLITITDTYINVTDNPIILDYDDCNEINDEDNNHNETQQIQKHAQQQEENNILIDCFSSANSSSKDNRMLVFENKLDTIIQLLTALSNK